MKHKLFVVAALVMLQASPFIPSMIIAQQPTAPFRSYQQARRVLDDAIAAHGGVEALRAIKDFTLTEKGKVYARYQSPTAEQPFAIGTSEETLIVDTDRGLVLDDLKTANTGFNNWIKTVIKGKFPVIGFVKDPTGVAALYLGKREGKELVYMGKVDIGWSRTVSSQIRKQLDTVVSPKSKLTKPIKKPKATWVEPSFVADIEYRDITSEGLLRASSFKGLIKS